MKSTNEASRFAAPAAYKHETRSAPPLNFSSSFRIQISLNATRQHFLIAPLEMHAHVRDKMIFIRVELMLRAGMYYSEIFYHRGF